jgi:hypothetical protein
LPHRQPNHIQLAKKVKRFTLRLSLYFAKVHHMTPTQAIKHFGSQQAISEILGVTEGAVSHWCSEKGGKAPRIPSLQQLRLETLTNGVLVADPEIPRGHKGRKPRT